MGINRGITTMVIMDEPHAKSIYGGTLAAPVFKRIMERSLKFIATRNQLGVGQERSPLVKPDDRIEVTKRDLVPAAYVRE
jgi:hypothetical protein